MYFLKQCPKCSGDLITDSDQYGDFISCLQCGLCKDIQAGTSGSPVVDLRFGQIYAVSASSQEEYEIDDLRPRPGQVLAAVPA